MTEERGCQLSLDAEADADAETDTDGGEADEE